ncbi:MAG: response regulator [Acidobacteriota bacterium]|nr:response regulator [Acidobacteriota bacterium]
MDTILLVDDMDEIRHLIRTALVRRGYRVVEASDGREAVEVAARERPQLILMDLYMPGSDGFAAMREIRAIEVLSEVPIIAITAYGGLGIEEHLRRQAEAAGCKEFLAKPFEVHQLEEAVDRHLHRGRD